MNAFDAVWSGTPVVALHGDRPHAVEGVDLRVRGRDARFSCDGQAQHLGVDDVPGWSVHRLRELHDPRGRRAIQACLPAPVPVTVEGDLGLHAREGARITCSLSTRGWHVSVGVAQPLGDLLISEPAVLPNSDRSRLVERLKDEGACGVTPVARQDPEGVLGSDSGLDRIVGPGVALRQKPVDEHLHPPWMSRRSGQRQREQVRHDPRAATPPVVGLLAPGEFAPVLAALTQGGDLGT